MHILVFFWKVIRKIAGWSSCCVGQVPQFWTRLTAKEAMAGIHNTFWMFFFYYMIYPVRTFLCFKGFRILHIFIIFSFHRELQQSFAWLWQVTSLQTRALVWWLNITYPAVVQALLLLWFRSVVDAGVNKLYATMSFWFKQLRIER